ncbi:hypothetical protein M8J75_005434 [Diaphorina citri]|nr:hypothetical protein M8J75_005434 [Diaphorina citri]
MSTIETDFNATFRARTHCLSAEALSTECGRLTMEVKLKTCVIKKDTENPQNNGFILFTSLMSRNSVEPLKIGTVDKMMSCDV